MLFKSLTILCIWDLGLLDLFIYYWIYFTWCLNCHETVWSAPQTSNLLPVLPGEQEGLWSVRAKCENWEL